MKNWLRSLNPVVSKPWLFLLAGIMWSGVGFMLCSLAYQWLAALHSNGALWVGLAGILLAGVVYRFGFSQIAFRNIRRLHGFVEKVCLFAFMPWKSYLLVGFMMGLGMMLRGSALPRVYLAFIYLGIGGALFLSSLHYYQPLWRMAVKERPGA